MVPESSASCNLFQEKGLSVYSVLTDASGFRNLLPKSTEERSEMGLGDILGPCIDIKCFPD